MKPYYLIVLFATIMFACKQEVKTDSEDKQLDPAVINNPATSSGENNEKSVPVFKFDSDVHDFGTITEGEKVSFGFKFKNVGNGDLVIRAAQGSCGCTVPEYPKEAIKPGGSGIINVTFNSEGKSGQQHKTVTLISNTMPNTYVLEVIGNVEKSGKPE